MGNSSKSSSRLFAVQILYEMELNGKSFEVIQKRFSDDSFVELEKGDAGGNRTRCMMGTSPADGSSSECQPFAFNYLDSPNTTDVCAYMWEGKCYSNRYITINGSGTSSDGNVAVAGIAILLAMEISS